MKKVKELIPAYIIAFCISFMLFIHEPIILYATNIEDIWFDIYILFLPMILLFVISTIGISLIYTLIYFISKKIFKKINIYNFCLLSSFFIFVYFYIQGNYLIGNLPPLDGTTIAWNNYINQNIISIVVLIVLIVVQVILVLKLKIKKCIKIAQYTSLAIVAMLTTSLTSLLLTTDIFIYKKTPLQLTDKNINMVSKDKNFFIFLADAVDSVTFNKVLSNSEKYDNIFKDFTYYPDTLAAYAYTRDSLAFILSGIWNENKTSFIEFSTNALNESKFLNELNQRKYSIGLFTADLKWDGKRNIEISNRILQERKVDLIELYKNEIKYVLFKYLPYYLKQYSKIDSLDFDTTRNSGETYDYTNPNVYNLLTNNEYDVVENKVFHLIHAHGGHAPFDLDENMNVIENGTYEQKLLATLKLINAYLNKLKANNVYDNSVIIIMSDHGYNMRKHTGKQNPILYIKGINEHHSSMKVSDKAISHADLQNAYFDLLDGKSSRELFKDIGTQRERRYMLYRYTKEDHMYEYIQTGKAWDENTLVATGREFILD